MNNEQSYTYKVHRYFYVETQCGRKLHNAFSYMCLRITFIGSTNFLRFPTIIGRRLWPLIFSGYNLRKAPTSQFSGYNQKEATTPYVLRLQPEGGYNHLSFSRPASLKYKWKYKTTVIVRYTTINLYQYVPTSYNQHVPITCDQPVLVTFLYQQKPTDMRHIFSSSRVCTWPLYTASYVCRHPVYTAACVHLLKTRVFTFLKNSTPLFPLSHQPTTWHCVQTVVVPYAYILIHIP